MKFAIVYLFENGKVADEIDALPIGDEASTLADVQKEYEIEECQFIHIVEINLPPLVKDAYDALRGLDILNENKHYVSDLFDQFVIQAFQQGQASVSSK